MFAFGRSVTTKDRSQQNRSLLRVPTRERTEDDIGAQPAFAVGGHRQRRQGPAAGSGLNRATGAVLAVALVASLLCPLGAAAKESQGERLKERERPALPTEDGSALVPPPLSPSNDSRSWLELKTCIAAMTDYLAKRAESGDPFSKGEVDPF